MKLITLAFLIIILNASNTYPCFCVEKDLRDEYESAAEVFAGEVIDVKPDPNFKPEPMLSVDFDIFVLETRRRFIVRLKVLENFKSAFFYPKEVSLYSFTGVACSRLEFKQGEKYLVFASKAGEGMIAGGSCSGTKKLDEVSQHDLKQLRNGWFWNFSTVSSKDF